VPQPKVDRSILQGEAVEIFRAAIKSDHTRDPYERRLLQFLNFVGMTPDKLVSISKRNPSHMEKKILSFISLQKKRVSNKEITAATVSNFLKAIRLLLEMNDVNLNWKKIRRILPTARRYALDRIPTVEEIREIVDASDIRGKALTFLFLSSGVREGAIEFFQIQDYSVIEKDGKIEAGRIVVYRGEPEEHVVFCSPEAVLTLDRYIQHRKEHGEKIRLDSPLFRDKFDPVKENNETKPSPMTAPAVRQYYNRLLFSIGVRKEKKRRHEFSVHSMRKWFKTRCEIGGMKPINVETLLNHSTGISDSYYRPRESEILEEYLAVVDHLSISTESKLRGELEEMRKIKNLEKLNSDTIAGLSDMVWKLTSEIEALKKRRA
jgi:integrase